MSARIHFHTWMVLVVLTLVSFALAASADARHGAGWLLLLAVGKGGVLGWRFMDLRVAHPAWKLGFLGFLAALGGLLAWFAGRFG